MTAVTAPAAGSDQPASTIAAEPGHPPAKRARTDSEMPAPPSNLTEIRRNFKHRPTPANRSLLDVAGGKSSSSGKIPVWAMRQAGRYLPEFKQVRSLSSFFEVCKTPKLAAEVTVQPLDRFAPDLDAVIIFSDILVIPVAMGMPCEMVPGKGPTFHQPLESPEKIAEYLTLRPDVEEKLGYVFDAIHWTHLRVGDKVPVIGFSGAPWTLLAYMIEGGGSKTWSLARKWLYLHREAAVKVMTAITDVIIDYLIAQFDAGASLLQVFDTNAGECPPKLFDELMVPELKRIAKSVKAARPEALLTIFAKDAPLHYWEDSLYDVVGVSWKQTPSYARKACPSKTLQGNLDPAVLYAVGTGTIAAEVRKMRAEFGDARLIANLGHGMQPDFTPDGLAEFIAAVKS
ncbi:unnamed protein product [Amoebophrya sp. A120]|nr:unnamed protein product [Amoebophrya sp. A120]|eukprot:GSA120T00023402001.1